MSGCVMYSRNSSMHDGRHVLDLADALPFWLKWSPLPAPSAASTQFILDAPCDESEVSDKLKLSRKPQPIPIPIPLFPSLLLR